MLRFLTDLSLEKRIPLFAGTTLVVILAAFTYLNLQAINESRNQALQERLVMAQMIGKHLDLTLAHALDMLDKTATLLVPAMEDQDPETEKAILASAYKQLGIFGHSLFLLDREGKLVWSLPQVNEASVGQDFSSRPFIDKAFKSDEAIISGTQCYVADGTAILCLAAPIKGSAGQVLGLVGGSINVADPAIGGFVIDLQLGNTGYIQIVDANGVVLANTPGKEAPGNDEHSARLAQLIREKKTIVSPCHNCHDSTSSAQGPREVVAFAPITVASWGVAIRQEEQEVFAQARELERKLTYFTGFTIVVVVTLVWLLTKGVTRPLGKITLAAERIALGDLTGSVELGGKDEIGRLSRAFEIMRQQLKDSMDKSSQWNRALEKRVKQRTLELEESAREIGRLYEELRQKEEVRRDLLGKIMTVQEDERRRIARELHDETSQALTALAVGLETAFNSPGLTPPETQRRIDALHALVINTLEEVHNLIYDLRPSSLDDLGLVATLQSDAESRLESLGIRVEFQTDGFEGRLSPATESALFRIAQEAMTNIVKHAEAENVCILLKVDEDKIYASIADDGRGFDLEKATQVGDSRQGFGLLGLTERVALLKGQMRIHSQHGAGTCIEVTIPLEERSQTLESDQDSTR